MRESTRHGHGVQPYAMLLTRSSYEIAMDYTAGRTGNDKRFAFKE